MKPKVAPVAEIRLPVKADLIFFAIVFPLK